MKWQAPTADAPRLRVSLYAPNSKLVFQKEQHDRSLVFKTLFYAYASHHNFLHPHKVLANMAEPVAKPVAGRECVMYVWRVLIITG